MTLLSLSHFTSQRGARSFRAPRLARVTQTPAVISLLLAISTTGVVTACTSGPDQLQFQVVSAADGSVLFTHPMEPGGIITMDHVHSVHKRPVRELFSVNTEGALTMEEMIFDRMGANLPFGPETINGVTTTFLEEDGHYRVLHHSRPLGTVQMLVGGPSVDHTLTMPDGSTVRMLELTRPRARVELRTSQSE